SDFIQQNTNRLPTLDEYGTLVYANFVRQYAMTHGFSSALTPLVWDDDRARMSREWAAKSVEKQCATGKTLPHSPYINGGGLENMSFAAFNPVFVINTYWTSRSGHRENILNSMGYTN